MIPNTVESLSTLIKFSSSPKNCILKPSSQLPFSNANSAITGTKQTKEDFTAPLGKNIDTSPPIKK